MALNVSLADDIDALLIDFYAHANAVHLITCDERGTGAQRWVEHDAVYQGTVFDAYQKGVVPATLSDNFYGIILYHPRVSVTDGQIGGVERKTLTAPSLYTAARQKTGRVVERVASTLLVGQIYSVYVGRSAFILYSSDTLLLAGSV